MDFRAAHPVTPPHMNPFGSEAAAVAAAAAAVAASGLPGLSPLSLLHHHSTAAAAAAPFAGSLYPGGKSENRPLMLIMSDILENLKVSHQNRRWKELKMTVNETPVQLNC